MAILIYGKHWPSVESYVNQVTKKRVEEWGEEWDATRRKEAAGRLRNHATKFMKRLAKEVMRTQEDQDLLERLKGKAIKKPL